MTALKIYTSGESAELYMSEMQQIIRTYFFFCIFFWGSRRVVLIFDHHRLPIQLAIVANGPSVNLGRESTTEYPKTTSGVEFPIQSEHIIALPMTVLSNSPALG